MRLVIIVLVLFTSFTAQANTLPSRISQVAHFYQALDDAYYKTETDHPATTPYTEALWPCVVFTGEPTHRPGWEGVTFSGSQCPMRYNRLWSRSTHALMVDFKTDNAKLLKLNPIQFINFAGTLEQNQNGPITTFKTAGVAAYHFNDTEEILNADIENLFIIDKSKGEKEPKATRALKISFTYGSDAKLSLLYRAESTNTEFNRSCEMDDQNVDCQKVFSSLGPILYFGYW